MFMMEQRQRRWNCSRSLICFLYSTHVLTPHRRVLITTALYTRILVGKRREWFCHTRFCRQPNALPAFDILFSTSFADVTSFVMMLPRYVNCSTSTMLSGCPSMWILGAMYGDLFFGWWSTSAFFKLTIPEGVLPCEQGGCGHLQIAGQGWLLLRSLYEPEVGVD